MSEDYGNDFITITDEDGNEFELEHLDTIEYNDGVYMAFVPADATEENDTEMIILKVSEEDGESFLVTPDSDEEADTVYEKFMEQLFSGDDTEI